MGHSTIQMKDSKTSIPTARASMQARQDPDHRDNALDATPVFQARDLNVHYGDNHALRNINVDIPEKQVTAFIGPSGCGKSTFLR